MCGYLSGLSSPSVTEAITTRALSPRSKSAGHTRLPTFSMNRSAPPRGCSCVEAAADHGGVEVAAGAGVDLHDARPPAARMRSASALGLLVALDHRQRQLAAEAADGALEERRFAGAGGAHEVDGGDVPAGPDVSRLCGGEMVVLREQRLLEGDGARARVGVDRDRACAPDRARVRARGRVRGADGLRRIRKSRTFRPPRLP